MELFEFDRDTDVLFNRLGTLENSINKYRGMLKKDNYSSEWKSRFQIQIERLKQEVKETSTYLDNLLNAHPQFQSYKI